ncbi:hypothetical protein M426DRAFT_82029 [Hypoxylon sp. CI-4A]|nr:hypothetical protein M426DRAFT_82029 [Hypoxylon sp. CI-4A]
MNHNQELDCRRAYCVRTGLITKKKKKKKKSNQYLRHPACHSRTRRYLRTIWPRSSSSANCPSNPSLSQSQLVQQSGTSPLVECLSVILGNEVINLLAFARISVHVEALLDVVHNVSTIVLAFHHAPLQRSSHLNSSKPRGSVDMVVNYIHHIPQLLPISSPQEGKASAQ